LTREPGAWSNRSMWVPVHRLTGSLAAALLAFAGLGAPPAAAGILVSATWTTEFTGYFGASTIAVPVVATGSSTDSAIAVSLTLPSFEHTSVHEVASPYLLVVPTYRALRLIGTQAIVATAGMASADEAIEGVVAVATAKHVRNGPTASMTVPGVFLFGFPLEVGVDGMTTGYVFAPDVTFNYATIDFYRWTAKAQTFTGLTFKGVALPSAKADGSFALTANGGGTVTLVAPTRIRIRTTGSTLATQRTVSVSTLKLTFVPEPRLLALAAAGLACLLALRARG
jgi:hypothetical protein